MQRLKRIITKRWLIHFLVNMLLNLVCPVPLPTMEGKLQAFIHPYYDGIQLQKMVFFLDSSKHLRRHWLLHNTLMSQNRQSVPTQGCHLLHQINHSQQANHLSVGVDQFWQVLGFWYLHGLLRRSCIDWTLMSVNGWHNTYTLGSNCMYSISYKVAFIKQRWLQHR